MSNSRHSSDFEPDYTRGRMDELARTRLLALILIGLGSVGLGLLCGALALAGVAP